jgi:glycolate oxidase
LSGHPHPDRWLSSLRQTLGDSKLLTGGACEIYTTDDSNAQGLTPDAVVFAESTADIEKTLAVATAHHIPVTPRGAGTGRVGGATAVKGGIVLCTVGMNQLKDIDVREQTAVVGPGLILEQLQTAVEREGLFYPPDPSSQATCTLGGNVAMNAGGPRAFKYGVTRNYVLGMDVTLPTGETFFTGRRTRKGVTGYDVAGLIVGSEGTLAVVGDITLQLISRPAAVMTLLALFDDVHHAGRCVETLIARGVKPRCIELLDEPTLNALRLAGNPVDATAKALILMELDGDEAAIERDASLVEGVCDDVKAQQLLVAQDAAQRDRLWSARRQMSHAVRRLAAHKLSEDVVVPRKHIGALLEFVAHTSEQTGIQSLTYGHAGDGNLHCNYLWNSAEEFPLVQLCITRLFEKVVALGGTLSGEHGIGLLKAPYLHLEQPSDLIALQRRLKHAFDPHGILNPGKIFPHEGAHHGGHGAC